MAFNGTEGEVIGLDKASEWTANWRQMKNDSDSNAFFFGREKIKEILNQPDCMGIRIYFGVNDDGEKALILVGAEANEDDQIDGLIIDKAVPCPTMCGSANGLNS